MEARRPEKAMLVGCPRKEGAAAIPKEIPQWWGWLEDHPVQPKGVCQ